MSSTPHLHPKIRERTEPRITATSLAEYLIGNADFQERVLHDSRFSSINIVSANGEALRPLVAYNIDSRRPRHELANVKAALTRKANDLDLRPRIRDEARRCHEAIELFETNENAFGTRGLQLSAFPTLSPLFIEGVEVSIKPHFLVTTPAAVGAGMIRVAKAPDPGSAKRLETRERHGEHRRDLAQYLVALLQILLDENRSELGGSDRDLCFVADVRLGERVGAAPDHTARLRNIRGACRQIAALWPTIRPRSSIQVK